MSGIGLTPEQLGHSFPFHIALGADGTIQQLGPSLAKRLPSLRPGTVAASQLRLCRPPVPFNFADLRDNAPSFIMCEHMETGLVLRGQTLAAAGTVLLLVTPWVTELSELDKFNITLDDFALHDPVVDFLTLLDLKNVTLREADELARALGVARRKAEVANEAKNSFLAMMSHEMRTPLSAILGLCDLLHGELTTQDRTDFLGRLEANGHALQMCIEEVLDFAKLEAGELRLQQTHYDPVALVEDVARSLASRAHVKGLALFVHADSDTPRRVIGDRNRIRQVLVNLIGNAVKFADHGHIWVAVRTEESERPGVARLRLEVGDTGPGIHERDREIVFERFVRLGSEGQRAPGTGLGLSIVKSVVALLGSQIELESTRGEGSRFHFALSQPIAEPVPSCTPRPDLSGVVVVVVASTPLEAEALSAALYDTGAERRIVTDVKDIRVGAGDMRPVVVLHDAALHGASVEALHGTLAGPLGSVALITAENHERGSATSAIRLAKPARREELHHAVALAAGLAPEPQPGPATEAGDVGALVGGHLLLVEDDPDNREVLRRLLEAAGNTVDVAADGLIALEKLGVRDYDLLISDLQMPRCDGLELIRELRSLEIETGRRSTPSVAVSAHALATHRADALSAGFDAFLPKPVNRTDLLATLERWVRRAPHALVIDDHDDTRLLTERLLQRDLGLRVLTASGGAQGVRLAQEVPISIVLLDMVMPKMDGYETARRLRALDTLRGVPIVALTGLSEPEDRRRAIEAGCDAYVLKPVRREVLARTVERLRLRFPPPAPPTRPWSEPPVSRRGGGASVDGVRPPRVLELTSPRQTIAGRSVAREGGSGP